MWKHCLNVRPALPASPALVFKWMLCRMLSRPRYAWAMVDVLSKSGCACRETEPNWDEDIEKDVKEECSKYGAVNHAHVDKNSKVRCWSCMC